MSNPYLIPNGTIKVDNENSFLDGFQSNDPTVQSVYFDDFNYIFSGTAGWTITETDAAATEAISSGANGLLLITNSSADNDIVSMQLGGSSGAALTFLPFDGRQIWFEVSLALSDATESEIAVGLLVTDTDPFSSNPYGGTDGIIFQKVDGSTDIDCYMTNGSAPSGMTAIGSVSNNLFVRLGFVVNGTASVDVYFNRNKIGTITSELNNGAALRPTISLKNGAAASKLMQIDYIFAAQTRLGVAV